MDKAQIRPEPSVLVRFTAEDDMMAKRVKREAKRWIVSLLVGPDGLTDNDRNLLAYAKSICVGWRIIMQLIEKADTRKCKLLLEDEMNRAHIFMLNEAKAEAERIRKNNGK